jgi:hypothetical protein
MTLGRNGRDDAFPESGVDIWSALGSLVRHPVRNILLRWNRKSAVLSAILRGTLFFAASLKSHSLGRVEAALVEAVYAASAAGLFGAVAQALRYAQPAWIAELFLAIVIPILFQTLEFFSHLVTGTGSFHAGLIASAALTGLSAAFNLFVMRRGALLVGAEGKPFSQDLLALPKLILLFVVSIPASLYRSFVEATRRSFLKSILFL